ncbi:MAG: hypothetical protein GY824_01105, partial [Delftia sp.]|nr:hypothetical protein [Delftia sp.]
MTYYVRAYAVCSAGTVFGNEVIFTALSEVTILTLSGPDKRTVYKNFIEIIGTVWDTQYTVTAASDRYPELVSAAVAEDTGAFSCEVPLLAGENLLTFTARNPAGHEARKDITVTFAQPPLPTVTITAPADGTTVHAEPVTVSGTVTSDPDTGAVTLRLGDLTAIPEGESGEYTFSFENVGLVHGANVLEVTAATAFGNSSGRVTVSYYPDPGEHPSVEILSPLPNAFFTENTVAVRGTAKSGSVIESVTVNGDEAVKEPETGSEVFFKHTVYFTPGADLLQITVTAKDTAGRSVTVTLAAEHDNTAPVITFSSPDPTPADAVITVAESPYPVAGTVAEKNLAGVSVSGTGAGVMPAGSDMWSFRTDAVLTAGKEQQITVEAWDSAGNRAVREFTLKLAASALIEMISPRDGSEYTASGTETEIILTARVSGAPEGAAAEASADGGVFQQIPLDAAGVANGTFVSPAADGDHILTLRISDTQDTVIAQTSVHYTVTNTDSIPLRVEKLDPANNAKNAEPDNVIRFHFNRPAGKITDFEATVKETAHGPVY